MFELSFKFDDLKSHAVNTERLYRELCSLKNEYCELLQPAVDIGLEETIFSDIEELSQKLDDNFSNAISSFEEKDLGEFAMYAVKCSSESENLGNLLLKSLVYSIESMDLPSLAFKDKAKEVYSKALDFSIHFKIFVNLI